MDAANREGQGIDFRMRKGWRGAWSVLGIVLLLTGATTEAGLRPGRAEGTAIRLTLDVSWGDPTLPALPASTKAAEEATIDLEVGEGSVLEASPVNGLPWVPRIGSDGSYRLGVGQSGKVRVRIETTSGSFLLAKAGGLSTKFAVASLFEAPLRTAATSPVPVQIERVSWDALEVRLGSESGSDGVFAPGSTIPTTLGFNILVPEPTEVGVKYWVQLRPARGGEAVWSLPPRREVLATNATRPPGVRVAIPAPKVEGSYVLEVHATWEPASNAEGSRLTRLFKKRRGNAAVDVIRRVSFVVLGNQESPPVVGSGTDTISDSLDLTRGRISRSMSSGRSPSSGLSWAVPESALVDPSRRDRLRGWNPFVGSEGSVLAASDSRGLAWSAMALKANHPGRPHRLTVKLAEGKPSDLSVALVAPGEPSGKHHLLLDVAASGPLIVDGNTPSFSWPVWPSSEELVLVLVNRSDSSAIKVEAVELRELSADPAPAVLAETHPEAPRPLALHLGSPRSLDRFGGVDDDRPADLWTMAQHVASYAMHCGASTVVFTSSPSDRPRRTSLEGQAEEDSTAPDRLDLILRALARRKLSALLEVRFDDGLPGLPPGDSPEALARGLVRVDRHGNADGPSYQPLRHEIREAMKARLLAAIGPRTLHPNLLGLVVRLGPGSTLPGSPDVGFDDATYPEFVRSAFQADALAKVPGLNLADPKRFGSRWQFVTGPGREDWLDWRAGRIGNLYGEFASAMKTAFPGAILAVATPGLDDGPAGVEARRADRAGLSPSQAWKAVGLDLARWPIGPVVLRGVGVSTDDLGHDLATHSDLDAAVASRPGRGFWYGVEEDAPPLTGGLRLTARPIANGPLGDEPLGHALAVLDARWIIVSGAAIAGQEERLSRFARVFRALPSPADNGPVSPRLDSGIAVRSWSSSGKTYIAMANDTPYVVLLESVLHAPADATVDDVGRRQRLVPAAAPNGAKSLVLELPAFGVATIRVGSASAQVEPIGPYLPAGRELDARRERLSALLDKMAQGETTTLPRNGGFEDSSRVRIVPVSEIRPPRSSSNNAPPKPAGWNVEGDSSGSINFDPNEPHSGKHSLRFDSRSAATSVASFPFSPPSRGPLTLHAWLRADRSDVPISVWVEGLSAGKPFSRQAEVKAGPEWSEVTLKIGDLPDGGLDRVRLRFERKTSGALWIDDVALSGESPGESTRRAQLVLTAALHAYREKRYADFARLAGSQWAKEAEPDGEVAPIDRTSPIRAAGTPTDLPSGRRLR